MAVYTICFINAAVIDSVVGIAIFVHVWVIGAGVLGDFFVIVDVVVVAVSTVVVVSVVEGVFVVGAPALDVLIVVNGAVVDVALLRFRDVV